ncbi:zinc ABC transporter solute-binding protein [Natronolimnobius sp. AArcel1]|uniref:metal ABC transporter substrate-binding protein n=1 Tax=Natronolimnobius sp. AArcel1 TaxID=1679093 RepID=UPI0013EDF624|nr:zinc ABC transporter substrate-binding protein [Natronolimnobius sp. AArcel1]NGM70975.1 zinc ABC transporter solute-binding protein [Natronolimnobius sp. AArcel1]
MNRTRRSVLRSSASVGAGAVALGGLAGCLSEPDTESNPDGGYAAFFALWDWAEQVSGDQMDFENPVDTGEMGHGWDPQSDLIADIAGTEVFVYLDTPEFAWAQDLAGDLENDYDHITLIDAMEGLGSELLPAAGDDHDHDHNGDGDHEEADEYDDDPTAVSITTFDLFDRQTGSQGAYWHNDHWHQGLPDVPVDSYAAVDAVVEDDDGRVLPLGEDEPFSLDARIVDGASEDVAEIESHGDYIEFHGLETGRTRVIFELVADDEVVWDSSDDTLTLEVVEELEDDAVPEFYDPHVWTDPVLAQEMIETIADGLADLDPDNAEAYHDNAADYNNRLEEVHEQFQTLSEEADRDIAVLAGHDSFQYIEDRYGFEIHTPAPISPDAELTPGDLGDTIELIDEYDIETILYDPFDANEGEMPREAEHLLENSQATEAVPISPAEGTMSEWNENDWGWLEQMEELNIPALQDALGAE